MSLKEFLKKRAERGNELKQMLEERRLEKMANDRMKTPQERELEDFLERKRQSEIKNHLAKFHEQERKQIFSGGIMGKDNMFKGHKNILQNKKLFPLKQDMKMECMFFK